MRSKRSGLQRLKARTGARRVVAETTAANAAAIKVLRRCSAVLVFDGSQVHAEIPVRPAALPLTPNPTDDGCGPEIAAQDTLSCDGDSMLEAVTCADRHRDEMSPADGFATYDRLRNIGRSLWRLLKK
jgi:hypothetical protein